MALAHLTQELAEATGRSPAAVRVLLPGGTMSPSASSREPTTDPQDLARLLVLRQQRGDADGMSALYEADAVLVTGDGQTATGREAIRQFYTVLIAAAAQFELGIQRPALIRDDLALTSTVLSDGTVTAEVARRQPDGSWLWVLDQPSIARVRRTD